MLYIVDGIEKRFILNNYDDKYLYHIYLRLFDFVAFGICCE